ncbi:helix-turn-helix domain-containing protein [Halorubrum sp. CSM-61]|uniref:helix-turn-helix domain-containing protein n=1 Tax=Halorubrum sp. CSM-61 TaxID=2485838 RepID=UPI000F4BE576|nr:helix-turn-helix domain-containing protein [Halorubrum sp. CSM-61]
MTRPEFPTATGSEGSARASGAVTSASTEAVDEALKTRTMDEAPVGITVADATQPDMPLVYVNAAFERVTGYSTSYAVGRNCRFLQGEATREKPVTRMRAAIEAGESTTVELRNYRRSGELFWNEVTLAPLRNDAGEVTYYVGFQQDVTRRKRAEQAVADRAARIERERIAQERLLERLDGVVADVTEAVALASSREELRREVVRSVADTYTGAWIGTYDPATETVDPKATAGEVGPDIEAVTVETADDTGRSAAPVVAAAVDDRRVRLEPIVPDEPTEAAAVAGVPLYFGEATYGVIAVYAQTEEFRRHERDVLTALGRTVAIGINALESQRTLRGEGLVEFELTLGGHPLGSFAEALSCSLRHVGTVGDRGERSLLFELDGATDVGAERVRAAAEAAGVTVHAVLAAETEVPVVELSVDETELEELCREYSGEVCGWAVEAGVAVATVEVGREALARSLAADAMERLPNADLRSYRRREETRRTPGGFVAEIESRLTERQRAALIRAHTSGYFEWPHETNGEEIADSMGVSRSTFHQHLRAAQRKIAAAIVERRDGL